MTRGLLSPDNNPGLVFLLVGNARAWHHIGHDSTGWLEWILQLRATCPGPIGLAARSVEPNVLGNVARMVWQRNRRRDE